MFVVWVVSVSHYVFEKKTQTICNGFVAIGWNPVAQLFRFAYYTIKMYDYIKHLLIF